MRIKVVIGCHNYLLAEGLGKLLEDEEDVDVIEICRDGLFPQETIKLWPDVVVLDHNMFSELQQDHMIHPQMKILLVGDMTLYAASDSGMADLISRGVVGILAPGTDSRLLKKALNVVCSGELWLTRKRMRNILFINDFINNVPPRNSEVTLTVAEKEIVSLICEGYSNKEIAVKRRITERTVKSHCNHIYKKVGVSDRLQLAIHMYKLGRNEIYLKH